MTDFTDSTEITAGIPRAFREFAFARRALRFHYLFAAPGSGVFGAAGFALYSWLVAGLGITPVEAGTVAMLIFLPAVLPRLYQPSGGYGSLSGAAVISLGAAVVVCGTILLLVSGSGAGTGHRLALLGVPALALSLLHSVFSASAGDRLDAILPGRRGLRFRQTLGVQTTAVTVAALILAGIGIDVAGPEEFPSYAVVFVISILFLLSSALFLRSIPPVTDAVIPGGGDHSLPRVAEGVSVPARIVLLDIAICLAAGMLIPFLLVFLISPHHMGLPLSTVALYAALFPAFAAPGRILWRWAGERFGARPVLQLTIPLLIADLLPLAFVTSGDSVLLAPLLGFSGFLFAGVSAGMDRAFGTAPDGRAILPRVYAAHGFPGGLAFALAPFAAGLMLAVGHSPFADGEGSVQTVFLAAAAALALTFPLLVSLGPGQGMSLPRALRLAGEGNPFLFAWNALLIIRARSEEDRERALWGLGRSGNPLAIPHLLEALGDPSPEVRRNAISALGRIKVAEAAPVLINELEDRESDMRCEAAEALGKIGDRAALAPLLGALGDRDIRLRNTAINALAGIGGDEVRDRLFELFVISYDTDIFPTLADNLSRLGATEIVEPVMRRLGEYESLMLRLQLLNAVCRALGAGNTFYRILSRHEYARVDEVNRLIGQARRHVRRSPLFRRETVSGMHRILGSIAESYRSEDHPAFLRSVWEFMAYMQLVVPDITPLDNETRVIGCDDNSPLRPHIEAVNRYLLLKETEDIRDEGMVFLVICINCLLAAVC